MNRQTMAVGGALVGCSPRATRFIPAAIALLLCSVSCKSGGPGFAADIHSADPAERILAIRQVGDSKDRSAVPLLVDRLDDEDEAVRMYAILALERITGSRQGYDYKKPGPRQVEAIERWRRLVREGEFRQAGTKPPADRAAEAPQGP